MKFVVFAVIQPTWIGTVKPASMASSGKNGVPPGLEPGPHASTIVVSLPPGLLVLTGGAACVQAEGSAVVEVSTPPRFLPRTRM